MNKKHDQICEFASRCRLRDTYTEKELHRLVNAVENAFNRQASHEDMMLILSMLEEK